jgi:hypothetical protein
VIEHPVKFQKRDQSEYADQYPKQDFETGERYEECDRPERNRADESQNKNRTQRDGFRFGLFKRRGHYFPSFRWKRALSIALRSFVQVVLSSDL